MRSCGWVSVAQQGHRCLLTNCASLCPVFVQHDAAYLYLTLWNLTKEQITDVDLVRAGIWRRQRSEMLLVGPASLLCALLVRNESLRGVDLWCGYLYVQGSKILCQPFLELLSKKKITRLNLT